MQPLLFFIVSIEYDFYCFAVTCRDKEILVMSYLNTNESSFTTFFTNIQIVSKCFYKCYNIFVNELFCNFISETLRLNILNRKLTFIKLNDIFIMFGFYSYFSIFHLYVVKNFEMCLPLEK